MHPTSKNYKKLPILSPKAARDQSFVSITSDVVKDSEIFHSMESSMQDVDAAWIETGKFVVQLGRKRGDVKLSNND